VFTVSVQWGGGGAGPLTLDQTTRAGNVSQKKHKVSKLAKRELMKGKMALFSKKKFNPEENIILLGNFFQPTKSQPQKVWTGIIEGGTGGLNHHVKVLEGGKFLRGVAFTL